MPRSRPDVLATSDRPQQGAAYSPSRGVATCRRREGRHVLACSRRQSAPYIGLSLPTADAVQRLARAGRVLLTLARAWAQPASHCEVVPSRRFQCATVPTAQPAAHYFRAGALIRVKRVVRAMRCRGDCASGGGGGSARRFAWRSGRLDTGAKRIDASQWPTPRVSSIAPLTPSPRRRYRHRVDHHLCPPAAATSPWASNAAARPGEAPSTPRARRMRRG